MAIDSFSGDFDFLSNFYGEGITLEHKYQASKTFDTEWQVMIMRAETPGRAKRLGAKAPMRDDWEEAKYDIMLELVREKFKDPILATKLVDTFPTTLIEGNRWHDNYWGECVCDKCFNKDKFNKLGWILMIVRGEVLAEVFKK